MGLEALSDADLMALKSGDLTKVSDAGLMALKQPSGPSTEQPSSLKRMASVATNAGANAVGGVVDMLPNTPSNLWNLVKAAVGTAAGIAGRPDLMPELTPAPDLAQRGLKAGGFVSDQDAPKTSSERRIAALSGGAVSGLAVPARGIPQALASMLTGALGGGAANETKEATGDDALALSAGMATPWAANKLGDYGRSRVAMADELKRQKAPIIDTTKELRDAGYKIPPAMTNPTMTNKVLEGIGGKAATAQDASLGNSDLTAKLIRKELGAPSSMGITEEALSDLSRQRAQPYRDLAELKAAPPARDFSNINPMRNPYPLFGPQPQKPEALLNEWRDTNLRAKLVWNDFKRNGGVQEYDKYQELRAKSGGLETAMEDAANVAGRPDLIPALRKARTDIAKIHDVERALNTDRGEVSAMDLSRARERGVPLSGGLLTAAKMGNSYSKAIQDAEKVGSPGVHNLNTMIGGGTGGVIGSMLGGAPAAGAGAIAGMVGTPMLQMGVRKMILSKPYQKLMGDPNYNASAMARLLAKYPEASNQQNLARSLMLANALQQDQEERQ